MRLLVLGGTNDGHQLAEALKQRGHEVLVSTLTAYGAELAQDHGLEARWGAMDEDSLKNLLRTDSFTALIDATHPYALLVTKMAEKVCAELSIPYFRWERMETAIEETSLLYWAEDIPEAAEMAATLGNRIMLTTGSKDLSRWTSLSVLRDKEIFIRVLPTSSVLAGCEALGFKPRQIIGAQGPFSQAWNEAMFRQLGIDVVVAKESGKPGGTIEKVHACGSLKIPLILIKRPALKTPLQHTTISEFIDHLEGWI